jgi:RHS repeat-associated protein
MCIKSVRDSVRTAEGSICLTTLSNSAGAVAGNYTYDSFDTLVASLGSIVNNFRYTWREWDSETSLYYYRARYYDPASGRFIREDPLRFGAGDPNFFSYVSQDPLNYRDPSGKTRLYGNWCGPDWTGGMTEQYDPRHASTYKKPIDDIDTTCMHHDICYFKCRDGSPCSPGGRSNCMTKCDQVFVAEMPLGQGRGVTGMKADAMSMGIYLHQFHPDPGPNSGGCGCGSGTSNQSSAPSIPLLRGFMLAHP